MLDWMIALLCLLAIWMPEGCKSAASLWMVLQINIRQGLRKAKFTSMFLMGLDFGKRLVG